MQAAQFFSGAPGAVRRETADAADGRFFLVTHWSLDASAQPMAVARLLKTQRDVQLRRDFEEQGQGEQPRCACSQWRAFCSLLGCRAKDLSWGERELEVGVWSEARPACGISLFISLETLALQDARTMKPFAEMFGVQTVAGPAGPRASSVRWCIAHRRPIWSGLLRKTENKKAPARKADTHFGS